MKMNIEEKARRYDEAIEKFDVILNLNTVKESGTIFADDVRKIFPELKDSKDEKIRKGLIQQFNALNTIELWHGIKRTDIIAYLEKQGEQKHTAEEVLIKAGLKPYKDGDQWCILLGDNIQEGICGFGNTIEDAFYAFLKDLIASQGEQKPADKVEPKFKQGEWITIKQ